MFIDRDENGKIRGVYARQQYEGQESVAADNVELLEYFNPTPTPEEAAIAYQLEITMAIQNLLDTTAQQRDYDDIFTLISYADDPDATFDAEGTAAKVWRSAVWTTARQIKADVMAGTRPMPTVEEVLSEMPVFVWPE